MEQKTDKQKQVNLHNSERDGMGLDPYEGQNIFEIADRISPSSLRILEEVKVRWANVLKMLEDH